ncbi:MAG: hypothetical protein GWO79_00885, partial [Actinobacteria bacterium]|nr:hypothetical protein [Actinomycetota bacterium]
PPRDEGFTISRNFYSIDDKDKENPIRTARVGDVLKGHIQIILPKARNFVAIEDYIPAGSELINFNLDTENISSIRSENSSNRKNSNCYGGYRGCYNWYDAWKKERKLNPEVEEMRNDRVFLFKERLQEGIYEYDYYIRLLVPGKFNHLPATVSEMYFPENFGRTSGGWFVVEE